MAKTPKQFSRSKKSGHADALEVQIDAIDDYKAKVNKLYVAHNDSLVRFVAARMHSEAEAREVAQEAYVRLLMLDKPDTVSYLRAYLFRIAANIANDRTKQRRRRNELDQSNFVENSRWNSAADEDVEADQALDLIKDAINELPEKCRTAFLLHKVHGLEVDVVASQMNLSIRMIRIYIARALAHCQEKLDQSTQAKRL